MSAVGTLPTSAPLDRGTNVLSVRDVVKHFPIRDGILQRVSGDGPGGRRRELRRPPR